MANINETFTGSNGSVPSGWTVTGSGTASIQSNAFRIVSPSSGTYVTERASRAGLANGDLLVDVTVSTLAENYPEILVRSSSATSYANGYAVVLLPADSLLQISELTAGTRVVLGTGASFTYTAGATYRVRFRWQGSTLQAKIWPVAGSEPASWMVDTSDASVTAAGTLHLASTSGATAAARTTTWDNLVVTDLDAGTVVAAAASFAGAGSMSVGGTRVGAAAASFAGSGAMSAGGAWTGQVAVPLVGAGAMSTGGTQTGQAVAAFAGAGALSADARRGQAAAVAFGGAGSMTVDARATQPAAVTFAGAGLFSTVVGQNAAAAFVGAGALTAGTTQTRQGAASLVGAGSMTVAGRSDQRVATAFVGAGALTVDGRRDQPAAAVPFVGAGAFTADGRRQHPASAVFAGAGALTAAATRVAVPAVTFAGSGHLTATARTSGSGFLNPSVWAVHPVSGVLVPLPHFVKLAVSPVLNGVGSCSVEYPAFGRGADLLIDYVNDDGDLEVETWLQGRRVNPMRWILSDADGDDTDEQAVNTYSGGSLEVLLDEGLVWNQPGADKQELIFSGKNAGTIVATVLQQIQARGGLAGITRDFSTTLDSAGGAWPTTVNIKFSPSATLLDVLQELVEQGLIEAFRLTAGRVLQLYRPGAFGVDRTVGASPVVFRRGRNLTEAPRRASSSKAGTHVLVAGSEGVYQNAGDPTALARRRRRIEVAGSANNVSDVPTVQAYAQAYLTSVTAGELEISHALPFGPGHPRPLTHYAVGDWVSSDTRGQLRRLRVYQWSVVFEGGRPRGELVLNTLRTDALLTLARKLKRISSGAEVVGTSTSTAPDTLAPAAPTGITANSAAYQDGPDTYATVTVGWTPVTTNSDASAADDVAGYRIQWRTSAAGSSGGWQLGADVANGSASAGSFGGVAAGIDVALRVAAYDRNGNTSAWSSPIITITTSTDTSAPPVPSAPVVSTLSGVLMAEWDGKGSAGESMPPDFDYVEVHVSTASNFTPDASTLYDRLFGAGTMPVTKDNGVASSTWYSVTRYVRFVALDRTTPTPNRSGVSAQGSGTPSQVVSADIFDGAVGSSKLALLAVKTANIDLLAVNDAQMGNVSAGKIITGVLTAAVTNAGIIRSGTTGSRYELDATSLRMYSGSNQTIGLVPGGVSFITGEFRTALSGQRVVWNPGGSLADTARFFPSGGGDYAQIMARTAPSDGSAAILIDGGAATGTARGRLGAYKGEAFVSYVANDSSGDGSDGYSRTAVSCNSIGVNIWAQNSVAFDKYSGSSFLDGSHAFVYWTPGSSSSYAPGFGASTPNAMVKLDAGRVLATTSDGAAFIPMKASAYEPPSSSIETKTDVQDVRALLTPLQVIRSARAKAWKYRDEVARMGEAAPQRLGPMIEDLPADLVIESSPMPDGTTGPTVDLFAQIGLLWAAQNQRDDQEIISTSATVIVPTGTRLAAGQTVELPAVWDSTPPAAPSGGFATVNSGLAWAGKVTAWLKPGSCTATGAVVVFKNLSPSLIVALAASAGGISAAVVGLGLYNPPYVPPGA